MRDLRTVRVGIVGVGGMGAFHARTLAATPGVDVVVVADVFAPNAQRLAAELGCEVSLDPLATAGRSDLDGLVIASPDDTHPDLAVVAIHAGSMVLCEKPLATELGEAWRVVEAEAATGRRIVQLGFMREYDPAHAQLVAAVASLGAIDFVRLVHRNVNAERRPLDRIIVQSLVHEAHSVRFLTGAEVVDVTAFGGGPENGSYRHVLVRAALSNGGHASLEFDDGGFAYEVSAEVLGRAGDAVTGPPLRAVTRRSGTTSQHIGDDWFGWFADAYRLQDAAWVASLRTGIAVGPSAWDGYAAQAIVQAAMASIIDGRTVRLDLPERPTLVG